MSILFGLLGGFIAFRLMAWRHFGRGHWRGRHRGWYVVRALGLSRTQRRELWNIFADVRGSIHDLRRRREDAMHEIAELLSDESFDRSRAERFGAPELEQLRAQVVGAAERVHQLLTPEQRARLRELIGGSGVEGGGGPDFGPYRSAAV